MNSVKPLIGFDTIIPKYTIVKNRISYDDCKKWVSLDSLNMFQNNIDSTFAEYVYPSVFTRFFTNYYTKLFIEEQNLYKLRVWANIYRRYKDEKSEEYNRYYLYRLFLKARQFCTQ